MITDPARVVELLRLGHRLVWEDGRLFIEVMCQDAVVGTLDVARATVEQMLTARQLNVVPSSTDERSYYRLMDRY